MQESEIGGRVGNGDFIAFKFPLINGNKSVILNKLTLSNDATLSSHGHIIRIALAIVKHGGTKPTSIQNPNVDDTFFYEKICLFTIDGLATANGAIFYNTFKPPYDLDGKQVNIGDDLYILIDNATAQNFNFKARLTYE